MKRMKVPPKVPPKPPGTPSRSRMIAGYKEPVTCFCRLRPIDVPGEDVCVTIVDKSTVQVVPPPPRTVPLKVNQYTFTGVFDEKTSQKTIFDAVTLPLIDDVLHGKNSLLFAYGVTGSGKTHTMNGELEDGGIIPRCVDVIFNTIGHLQAKKYTFKPDRMNGFEILIQPDAHEDERQIASARSKTPSRSQRQHNCEGVRVTDSTKVGPVDEDQTYAVFVTFVEVYNNTVFDLLDDTPIDPMRPKQLQSKILREDAHHMMYVHGVTELEVKSPEEATEVLAKGQKRRRVAHTTLNAESSRSHSVFNIRVVAAPLDAQGWFPEKMMTIGQLSLVDLAGSERNNRSKTSGERLREASSINNTLLTLRSCIEILRENQMSGTNRIVPYRDSKITHLFKSFFDGEGKVRILVCVNPRAEDFDETVSVMRFAEMAQEVQIARTIQPNVRVEPATPKAAGSPALLAGRRKANRILNEAYRKLERDGEPDPRTQVPFDVGLVFSSVRSAWPPLELSSSSDETLINNLVEYLQARINDQQRRREEQLKKCLDFRSLLCQMEEELILKRQQVISLNAEAQEERKRREESERRALNLEAANNSLQTQLAEHQRYEKLLEDEIDEKEMQVRQGEIEVMRVAAKEKTKRQLERERIKKELERCRSVEAEYRAQAQQMRKMKEILDTNTAKVQRNVDSPSASNLKTPTRARIASPASQPAATPRSSLRGPALSTRRRSRSADHGVRWLDHRPSTTLDLDTVLQPQLGRAKSITKLTDAKDITNSKVSKYLLTTQEQDSAGEIETKIYKGDIRDTVSGGAQVVLQDVEVLRQEDCSTTGRKRASDARPDVLSRVTDIESRCAVSIEGHGPKKFRP